MNISKLKIKLDKYRWTRSIYYFLKAYKRRFIFLKFLKHRVLAKIQGKTIVHFLHIGKTGGSSVKFALNNRGGPYINDKYIVFSHSHSFRLRDVFPGEKCFFFTRDIIDRFISGFYSRKRKGMPRIYREWTHGEEVAFNRFKTPNELATSLSSKRRDIKNEAIKAMKSIGHVNSSYWDWFENEKYFLSRIQDIIFVGTQENLNEDFIRLKEILHITKNLVLPKDEVNMHKNPEFVDKHLDPEAIQNLKKWYSRDYQFLKLLKYKV